MKIGVLISGSGTNLQSIIDKSKQIGVQVKVVVSNKKDAFGLERAKKAGIRAEFVDADGKSREEHEKEVAKILDSEGVELVVLAGYMRMLTPWFIRKYHYKIINIHPALLPSFAGTHGYEDAWNYGVKVSGCTVHFVDEGMDSGPIIIQRANEVKDDDTLETFRERGLKIEHEALPLAIKLFAQGKLKIEGRKVKILK